MIGCSINYIGKVCGSYQFSEVDVKDYCPEKVFAYLFRNNLTLDPSRSKVNVEGTWHEVTERLLGWGCRDQSWRSLSCASLVSMTAWKLAR